jgi:pimeloyl-ACP methyl ester carboxylesterase
MGRWRWLPGGVFAMALVTSSCSGSRETAEDVWPSWLRECTHEGLPARCGTVERPETGSASLRTGRLLSLRVVVLPEQPSAPSPDAILALAGGPGQAATESAGPMASRVEAYGRDVVLIDQRGTGEADGLHCPPPASAVDLMGHVFEPQRLEACRDALAARADLTRYTTTIAAEDHARILERLPYRQVNVWGVSYGTRMALAIARQAPARVRTMILEGAVPMNFTWPTSGATDVDAALDVLAGDCARDPQCSAAFPDVGRDIAAAFDTVRRGASATVQDPATGSTIRVPFGVTDLAYAMRGLLYNNDAWSLPSFFRQASEGRFEPFAQAYVNRARSLDRSIARGVHLGVYCAEDLPYVDWASATARAAGTRIGTYLLDEYRRACEVWPRGAIPPGFRDPVSVSVPTLLLSGRRDPVTPPRNAEEVARTLPRSRVLVWPYGGHGTDGLQTADCRTRIVREFLQSADPDGLSIACMTQDPSRTFVVGR